MKKMKELAYINGTILRWAREELNYTEEELAKTSQVTIERYQKFENGTEYPTFNQLFKFAKKLSRPSFFFYLKTPPAEKLNEHKIPSFRIFTKNSFRNHYETKILSPNARKEIRRCLYRKKIFEILSREVPSKSFQRKVAFPEDLSEVEEIARREREHLAFDSFKASKNFKNNSKKILFNLLEEQGILVFQSTTQTGYSTERDDFLGFSLSERPNPVILIQSNDPPNSQRFTLFHEYAHILFGKSNQQTRNDEEKFANRFAGAFLLSKEEIESDFPREINLERDWEESEINEKIRKTKEKNQVSQWVVARRLYDLKRVSHPFYQKKQKEYKEEIDNYKKEKEKNNRPPSKRMVQKWNGHLYTNKIIESLNQGEITVVKASEYLGTRATIQTVFQLQEKT